MTINTFITGDYIDYLAPEETSLVIADPVYETNQKNIVAEYCIQNSIPVIIFMFPGEVFDLNYKPDQLCHWIKPVSTKNTVKNYSNFIEAIAMYGVSFYEKLHWSNRTGIFTDVLLTNEEHMWKKPESLIERLLRNHYPGHGIVFDPFAGSGTTHVVCKKLGISSVSVEINEIYNNGH